MLTRLALEEWEIFEGRLDQMGLGSPVVLLSGRRCLNIMQAMIMENMDKKDRHKFEEAIWMTGEEALALAERTKRRNRSLLSSIGEMG